MRISRTKSPRTEGEAARTDMPQLTPLSCQRHAMGLRLRQELRTCSTALRRISQARARQRKAEAMTGTRDWQRARRARTRLLIEYGGLVVKAGLAELLEDDRATLLGGLFSLRDQLKGLAESDDAPPATLKLRWRRRGLNAFAADANADAGANASNGRGPGGESNQGIQKGNGRKEGDREGGESGAV